MRKQIPHINGKPRYMVPRLRLLRRPVATQVRHDDVVVLRERVYVVLEDGRRACEAVELVVQSHGLDGSGGCEGELGGGGGLTRIRGGAVRDPCVV